MGFVGRIFNGPLVIAIKLKFKFISRSNIYNCLPLYRKKNFFKWDTLKIYTNCTAEFHEHVYTNIGSCHSHLKSSQVVLLLLVM
jgi:hypothetical protein